MGSNIARSLNRAGGVEATGCRWLYTLGRFAAALALSGAAGVSCAETWTAPVGIEFVEPLAAWQGGMVRVKLDAPLITTQCGTTSVVDFMLDPATAVGTPETRSAVIAALYMAHAMERKIKMYVVDNACSPAGAPMFTGLDVLR